MTNGDITTGNWQLATGTGMHRDGLDTCPCLLDAVLSAADSDDVRADVGLVDNAPAV
ncbi:hypothetical protein [Streptomyces mirabilis]|uniref:hypothetical protein n=1 Tax=Streptomyces mirabilis TaxID=68239 RepID=UPI00332CC76C